MIFSSTETPNHPHVSNVIILEFDQDFPNIRFNDFGYSYLQFGFGKTEAYNCHDELIETPGCSIKCSGSFWNVNAFSGTRWVFLELPTTALHKITHLSAKESANDFLDFRRFVSKQKIEVLKKIYSNENDAQNILTEFDNLMHQEFEVLKEQTPIDAIVSSIFSKNGMISLEDIEADFHGSRRTMERQFQTMVGHSPQKFIRLVRFNYIIRELEAQTESLESLVHKYDYYDRSHFEKDFQLFFGCKISGFKNLLNPVLSESLQRYYQ